MKHEKIIRREDGSRIKIEVDSYIDSFRNEPPEYRISTSKCEKGKRIFKYPHSSDDYTWRALNMTDRKIYSDKKYMALVSEKEVYDAKLELWEMMKPGLIS